MIVNSTYTLIQKIGKYIIKTINQYIINPIIESRRYHIIIRMHYLYNHSYKQQVKISLSILDNYIKAYINNINYMSSYDITTLISVQYYMHPLFALGNIH